MPTECKLCKKNTVSQTKFYNEITWECDNKRCTFTEMFIDHTIKIPNSYTKTNDTVQVTLKDFYQTRMDQLILMQKVNPREWIKDEMRLLRNKPTEIYSIVKDTTTHSVIIPYNRHSISISEYPPEEEEEEVDDPIVEDSEEDPESDYDEELEEESDSEEEEEEDDSFPL